MSAFIVEDSVINSVIAYLAMSHDSSHIQRTIKEETGCDVTFDEGCAALGAAMFALNINAVDQRYGKGESAGFRDLDYAYRSMMPPSIMQAYKHLQCWLYQCSEGDVPSTSLLYATMDRVSNMLAHEIVSKLPEYQTAKWSR